MNVVGKRLKSKEMHFVSANDLIRVDIDGNGPELLLADGSSLIFASDIQYYSIISDSSVYTIDGQIINIDVLELKYANKRDDTVFDDIIEVQEFTVNDKAVYRLIRD